MIKLNTIFFILTCFSGFVIAPKSCGADLEPNNILNSPVGEGDSTELRFDLNKNSINIHVNGIQIIINYDPNEHLNHAQIRDMIEKEFPCLNISLEIPRKSVFVQGLYMQAINLIEKLHDASGITSTKITYMFKGGFKSAFWFTDSQVGTILIPMDTPYDVMCRLLGERRQITNLSELLPILQSPEEFKNMLMILDRP